MKVSQWITVALTAVVGFYIHTANATLIFSVDLDPSIAGIQDTLTVTEGDVFTVDFTVTDDGATSFNTFLFDIIFNDAGAVLGSGPIGPRAGSIASPVNAPAGAQDFSTLIPVIPGDPLFPVVFFPPPLGFANQSGEVGIFSTGFTPFILLGAGQVIDLFSLDFVASAVGTSTISTNTSAVAAGFHGFFNTFIPVFPTPVTAPGQVTVQSAAPVPSVPEPSTILLFSISVLGLIRYARQQQKLT